MTSVGMRRGDMHEPAETKPMKEKDWENEMVYPSLRVDGKQAEKMGAEDLEDGECVEQTVVWRVRKTTIEKDGEKKYELTLELVKASNPKSVTCDEGDGGEEEPPADNSPGLDYIMSGKAR